MRDQPLGSGDQPPIMRDQPLVMRDQPLIMRDQPLIMRDQSLDKVGSSHSPSWASSERTDGTVSAAGPLFTAVTTLTQNSFIFSAGRDIICDLTMGYSTPNRFDFIRLCKAISSHFCGLMRFICYLHVVLNKLSQFAYEHNLHTCCNRLV
jgi:hypothetical protein